MVKLVLPASRTSHTRSISSLAGSLDRCRCNCLVDGLQIFTNVDGVDLSRRGKQRRDVRMRESVIVEGAEVLLVGGHKHGSLAGCASLGAKRGEMLNQECITTRILAASKWSLFFQSS